MTGPSDSLKSLKPLFLSLFHLSYLRGAVREGNLAGCSLGEMLTEKGFVLPCAENIVSETRI